MAMVYEDLAVYGERLGASVIFDPHINHLVNSEGEWKRFMMRLDACKLCLDISHAVRDFAARIAYVHLHDFKDGKTVELRQGPMCDYPAFMAALEEVGYAGWITVCPGEATGMEEEKMRVNREYMRIIGY